MITVYDILSYPAMFRVVKGPHNVDDLEMPCFVRTYETVYEALQYETSLQIRLALLNIDYDEQKNRN